MNKTKKMVVMLLMVFGAVSVSMGAYIPKSYEENYQKLKAEMEEAESSFYERWQITCSWDEDGKVVIGDRGHNIFVKDWCELKNVLAFFDEIRAMEVKVDKKKGEREFYVAINKVKQMPRFKEDSGIGITQMSINESRFTAGDNGFWSRVFEKWEEVKLKIVMEKNGI